MFACYRAPCRALHRCVRTADTAVRRPRDVSGPRSPAFIRQETATVATRQTRSAQSHVRRPRRRALHRDGTRAVAGLEDGVEWTYPMLSQRFNQTTNVLKGIVRTEVNFLRRSKKEVLQEFANHM